MNLTDLPHLRALGDVLWGSLWLTPRGFAYAALLMALTYGVAMWRASRVYARTVAHSSPHSYRLSEANTRHLQVEGDFHDKLRLEPVEKLRTILLWVVMVFTMLAVQAYVLATTEQARIDDYLLQNDILFYTPLSDSLATYYSDLVDVFGLVILGLVGTWIWSHWVGEFGPSFKTRMVYWVSDLVEPIEPGSPLNRAQRTLAWLRLIDVSPERTIIVENIVKDPRLP